MPKIARFYEIGGPEVLKLEEMTMRPLREGEARLRVQAVGLNRAEALFMRGLYFEPARVPGGVGYEAAGIVEAVGSDADRKWIGKEVATVPGFSMNDYGVLGEEAIVPAHTLAEYPSKLSPIEGAAIWMQYLTSYGGLIQIGGLRAGDFVVISAASSSVGLAAIQMAKAEGAIPIATTRTSNKRDELLALGADHVIATEEEDFVARVMEITGGKGARLSFDPVAGPWVEKLAKAAAHGGIIVEYGALSLQQTPFPLRIAMSKALAIHGYTLHEVNKNPSGFIKAKQYVFDRLQDGRFHPKIAKTFPLAQAREAYEYLESNVQVGKVVITVE